jgi:hypothetical protein
MDSLVSDAKIISTAFSSLPGGDQFKPAIDQTSENIFQD